MPAKAQFLGESLYGFVRNDIVGDAIGAEGRKYVPYLTTLFVYIAVMDLFGIVPIFQLPATSKIGIPLFLALVSWGDLQHRRHPEARVPRLLQGDVFPPGLPKLIYVLLAPLEFFSTFIIRPITLTLRLTLNMFAGHLVLLVTILGGAYLLEQGGALALVASPSPGCSASSSRSSRRSSSCCRPTSSSCSPPSTSPAPSPTSTELTRTTARDASATPEKGPTQ